jgi:Mn-dependent DtxR family transcriptional regulator
LTHLPAQLSGGEQQRVAIARALINQPKLILADEPTGNLDQVNEAMVIEIFRELHNAGHTILMVTHDPDIARQADRRIELDHGHLHFDTALEGAHPVNCPLAVSSADCCAGVSTDDEISFDHLLEHIWICGEEGRSAEVASLRVTAPVEPSVAPPGSEAFADSPRIGLAATLSTDRLAVVSDQSATRLLTRLSELHLVEMQNGEVQLTTSGSRRARDIIRRHRLAERLFKDTFAVDDSELHSQACKFEHIISPQLDRRICSFLGHPKTCPHGNAIPPGDCCNGRPNA